MKEHARLNDFIRYLNRGYWITSHLIERLDELNGSDPFADYQQVIDETLVSLESHLAGAEKLFDVFKISSSFSGCEQVIAFLESIFTQIFKTGNTSPHLSLLDYVSNADCLMLESAKLAQLSLGSLYEPGYRLYEPLLLQSLKEALESKEFSAITK